MLFDYRKQTELVSLDGIKSWLETKDSEQKYNYSDCKGACLFSQYLTEREGAAMTTPTQIGNDLFNAWVDLHEKYRIVAQGWPWTYGAALKRAREFAE